MSRAAERRRASATAVARQDVPPPYLEIVTAANNGRLGATSPAGRKSRPVGDSADGTVWPRRWQLCPESVQHFDFTDESNDGRPAIQPHSGTVRMEPASTSGAKSSSKCLLPCSMGCEVRHHDESDYVDLGPQEVTEGRAAPAGRGVLVLHDEQVARRGADKVRSVLQVLV